jgi:hypothetical protein
MGGRRHGLDIEPIHISQTQHAIGGITMKNKALVLVALSPFLAACSDDPTGPGGGFDTEDLSAGLAIAPGHFHIWETEGVFTVNVTDPNGASVTDFEAIQVERRREGTDTWRAIALTQDGAFYEGTYIFDTSGNYNLRVTGMRASDDEMKVLHVEPGVLEVVRAHAAMGGYTVSFEVFPGHIHRLDEPTFTWWFEGAGAHAPAVNHPPAAAPTMSVECDGGTLTSPLTEAEPGRWEGVLELLHIGDCDASVHFVGTGEAEHTYSVPIHISEAH